MNSKSKKEYFIFYLKEEFRVPFFCICDTANFVNILHINVYVVVEIREVEKQVTLQWTCNILRMCVKFFGGNQLHFVIKNNELNKIITCTYKNKNSHQRLVNHCKNPTTIKSTA